MKNAAFDSRVVITGIGMITSVGADRETVWQALQSGVSGVRILRGVPSIPDDLLLGAPVDLPAEHPSQQKNVPLCLQAANEALVDGGCDLATMDRDRFGCAVSAHMGDTYFVLDHRQGASLIEPAQEKKAWWKHWLPNTACSMVANRYGLRGPRICHSTACSSGLVDILSMVRAIEDGQCDIALVGSSEAIHPLLAAGFHRMGVLAKHSQPTKAARPFDADRSGFVMGEGAAMLILERLDHARARGARIYAEVIGGRMLAAAYHVTSLDAESEVLARLITDTLRQARLRPHHIDYINVHGTGTQQNDLVETRGIRQALGAAADSVCASASKSMLGHLVNASGSVETAITSLTLRDGFAPPTINLTRPDPECDLDYIPLVGRPGAFEHALKLSLAFGGHLAAVALRRWDGADGRGCMKRAA